MCLLIAVAACDGGDGEPEPPDEGPPILDRAPRLGHTCAVESDVAVVAQNRGRTGIALARAAGRTFAASATSAIEAQVGLVVSELLFDPVELAPPAHDVLGSEFPRLPALVARDGALGLSWIDSSTDADGQQLSFAVLDSAGELTAGPTAVTTDGAILFHAAAAGADGFALLLRDDGGLRFLQLDDNGAPVGEPVQISTGDTSSAHLARHRDGFAAAWVENGGVHLAVLDRSGTPLGQLALLSAAPREGEALRDPFVAAAGDELVVAWTESHRKEEGFDPLDGRAVVRLARVNGNGDPLGPAERLQDPEDGIESVLSSLLPVDGALAVAWSRGTYIPICGGCVSDSTMRFVLLDPVDRVPVSDQVELIGPSGLAGAPMVGGEGGDVDFFLTVDYHALADLAAAKIGCARK